MPLAERFSRGRNMEVPAADCASGEGRAEEIGFDNSIYEDLDKVDVLEPFLASHLRRFGWRIWPVRLLPEGKLTRMSQPIRMYDPTWPSRPQVVATMVRLPRSEPIGIILITLIMRVTPVNINTTDLCGLSIEWPNRPALQLLRNPMSLGLLSAICSVDDPNSAYPMT